MGRQNHACWVHHSPMSEVQPSHIVGVPALPEVDHCWDLILLILLVHLIVILVCCVCVWVGVCVVWVCGCGCVVCAGEGSKSGVVGCVKERGLKTLCLLTISLHVCFKLGGHDEWKRYMYFYMHPHVCTSPVLHNTCIYATFFFHWDGISTKEEIALSTIEMTCEEQVSNSTMHSCSFLYAAHKCPRLSQHIPKP